MKLLIPRLTVKVSLVIFISLVVLSEVNAQTLQNDKYKLQLNANHTIGINVDGIPTQVISPRFVVMISKTNPGLHRNNQNYPLAPRTAIRWNKYQQGIDSLRNWLEQIANFKLSGNSVTVNENSDGRRTWTYNDGKGKQILKVAGEYATGTTNPFAAGHQYNTEVISSHKEADKIIWKFKDDPYFELSASVQLGKGSVDPQINYTFKPKANAYYSIAFIGTPAIAATLFKDIPQEVAGRNYQQFDHLVSAAYLRLPRAQIYTGSWNAALVVSSNEMPFNIPTNNNARFGLMIQSTEGVYRPVSFAPIMGGQDSKMKAGQTYSFKQHYSLSVGDWKQMYEYIARDFYDFKDMRDNSGTGSINKTISNAIDYMSNRNGKNYAFWHKEQKYFDYWTDNSGIFKPFSPLYMLSTAIVTDDEELYWDRALPQVEFALSRTNNTFAPYDVAQNGQVKKRNRELGSSYLAAPQLVSLYQLYQGLTPSIKNQIFQKNFNNEFSNRLAAYQLSGKKEDLKAVENLGIQKLKKEKLSAKEEDFMDWIDLYEATKNSAFLSMAKEKAYGLTTGINLSPATPDTVMIFDLNGKVPIHDHSNGRFRLWGFLPPTKFDYKQQQAPAWRVSLTGLTSPAYRGEYWMNNHGQLMRLASLTDDKFLRDIARWGMVGRFGNYAGDNRSSFSLIAESTGAVENPMWKLSFATVNPGHVSEFTGALFDFLISDVFERSKRNIDFPSRSMQGTSFRVKVYGDRPGVFYTDSLVKLWLPKNLLSADNEQFDYIAGYNGNTFYLACINQSFKDEKVNIKLNPDLVLLFNNKRVRTWINNLPAQPILNKGQALSFTIPAKGIVAFAINEAAVKTKLQKKLFAPSNPLGASSFSLKETSFGKLYGQILSMGEGLSNAFVYTDALPENVISSKLRYRVDNGAWVEANDAIFPFEYSIRLPKNTKSIDYEFKVENADQKEMSSGIITLKTFN